MIKTLKNAAQQELSLAVRDLSFLFVAVNAKFVHTNLAVRYLKNNCDVPSEIREYSINDDLGRVCADIFKTGIKTVLFSCYIWNIEYVLRICEVLKKADSNITIVLGGPEVSFSPEEIIEKNDYIDIIVCGEGELALDKLKDAVLTYNGTPQIIKNEEYVDLDKLVFPYEGEDLSLLDGKILYYETSRGCPYRCAFCLSGAYGKVRYLSLERVKREIEFFIDNNVKLVKLVDRTFNADSKRALEIVEFIKEKSKGTTFHFEIKAEIMKDDLIDSLISAPKGMFQVEIGVQSTDKNTLLNINRTADIEKLKYVVKRLMQNDNLNVHLDLIAGLPGESMESFINSFNEVLSLFPHVLQLGFLKRLKGSALNDEGSKFSEFPPYEVISSDRMTYSDLLILKSVEEVLEKYYNSGSFKESMGYILNTYYKDKPFDFFLGLGEFYEAKAESSLSKKAQFELLKEHCDKTLKDEKVVQAIIFDYCRAYRDNLSFMKPTKGLKERAFEFLKDTVNVNKYFSCHEERLPVQLYKKLRFFQIGKKIYVFDYIKKNYYDITEDMPKG